jgi:hypothetical protein
LEVLQKATDAHLMTCTRALVDFNGNLHDALDWLRKKGYPVDEEKIAGLEELISAALEPLPHLYNELSSQYPRPNISTSSPIYVPQPVYVQAHFRAAPRRKIRKWI